MSGTPFCRVIGLFSVSLDFPKALCHSVVMRFWGKLLGLPVLLLTSQPLAAHPHVWVDVQVEVVIDQGTANGLDVVWLLDEEFSQLILSDCDSDQNGRIDPSEVARVKAAYFDNLRLFDYFCHIYLGKKSVPTPVPQKFQADLQPSGKCAISFSFRLTLNDSKGTFVAVVL